jgi:hypothetical protein
LETEGKETDIEFLPLDSNSLLGHFFSNGHPSLNAIHGSSLLLDHQTCYGLTFFRDFLLKPPGREAFTTKADYQARCYIRVFADSDQGPNGLFQVYVGLVATQVMID